jgi:hypothetical protein
MIWDFSICQGVRQFLEFLEFVGLVLLKCMHSVNTKTSAVELLLIRSLANTMKPIHGAHI